MSKVTFPCDCGGKFEVGNFNEAGEFIDLRCNKCELHVSRRTHIFRLCGCGKEDLEPWLISILKAIKKRSKDNQKRCVDSSWHANTEAIEKTIIGDDPSILTEFVLHMLHRAGLTEHGSNISGSWLTDKGEDVLRSYKEVPFPED